MAIYHFSAQIISRSKGQSSVAAAAYRSGERLKDERTGETKFYKREIQPETMILAPSHSPKWIDDRERLWNEVETSETRKNSQLAREINIALPKELTTGQQRELIQSYVQSEFVNKGMVADIAIHRDDKENPHAHVMLTTREISEEGFTVKNRDWNDRELLNQWREQWAEHTNKSLEKAGIHERISHLSHEARGLEQMPTIHLGHVAHDMEKKGIETDRGNINRERQDYNQIVVDLQKYREEKERLQKQAAQQKQKKDFLSPSEKVDIKEATKIIKGYVTLKKIEEHREQLDKRSQSISKSESYYAKKDEAFNQARGHIRKLDNIQDLIEQNKNDIQNINWINPFKIKENNLTKERCQNAIEDLNKQSDLHEQEINYYRDKLDFTSKEDFFSKAKQFTVEKEEKAISNFKDKVMINQQKSILDKAEKAIKQGEVREITSHYPELKSTGEFMKYEEALKLKAINEKAGKIVPLDQIRAEVAHINKEIDTSKEALHGLEREKRKLATAHVYFKKLHEVESKIVKTENSPFLKGKLMFSEKAKNEYEQHQSTREQYKSALNNAGFKNIDSFHQRIAEIQKAEDLKPLLEKDMNNLIQGNAKGQIGIGLDFLEGALQGIEQASKREEREKRKNARKPLYRGQKQHEEFEI